MKNVYSILLLIFFFPLICLSQKGMTTVGIQIKPIFPFSFQGTGKLINDAEGVHFETGISSGFSGGLIIRHNFTKLLAFETGINYVKRKYSLTITDGAFTGRSYFHIVNYEIPAVLMAYTQLGENIYINGSLGPTLGMYVSSIQTTDYYFNHVSFRNHIFLPAISANAGCEYRTEKSGIIYIGVSYLRPFAPIFFSKVGYYGNGKSIVIQNDLPGNYITIDLRYFFPETKTKTNAKEDY